MNPIKNIFFLVAIFLGLSFQSYSQSSDNKSKTDKFGGIGVSVDIDSSVMLPYIVDILSAKPGAMAGLRSGDHIISINSWKTKGKSQEQVAGKLRGRVGSEVVLTISRGGRDTVFAMKREHIEVNEKDGNFCEALDTLLKAGEDSFLAIRGELVKSKYFNDFSWYSKLSLPRFTNSKIDTLRGLSMYYASYFIGTDSLEAVNKYKQLVTDIKDCLPYTISNNYKIIKCPYYEKGYATNFIIDQMKDYRYGKVKGLDFSVIFNCRNDEINVFIHCQTTK